MISSKRIRLMGAKTYHESIWKTDNTSVGSSTDHQVALPFISTGTYNCMVEWGDGSQDYITTWNQAETTHTYDSIGTYTIKIKGQCEGFRFNNTLDKLKLLTIERWGKDFTLGNVNSVFNGCTNLQIDANDILNTSEMTDMYNMFRDCTSLNCCIKFSDTSNVTNFTYMFRGCTSFNGDISSLNTENGTTIAGMFYGCSVFNSDVSHLNTSNVENMYALFYNCSNFDKPVNTLDTSKVENMEYMFSDCPLFNQSLSNFNTSSVTSMRNMFYGTGIFNQDLSNFDTSLVENMSYMFYGKQNFNQDLSSWNLSSVTTMSNILVGTTSWSTANYDAFLISADGQVVQSGVDFDCSSNYTLGGAAEAARTSLITGDSWNITDSGGI